MKVQSGLKRGVWKPVARWLVAAAVALVLVAVLAPMGVAQLRFEGQQEEDLPIHITSDHMEADNEANIVVFSGNVESVRGKMTVTADRMRVFNSENENRVEKIIWTRNVHFEMEGQNATAETAIFSDADQTLTLTGNPEAWEGENRVTGEEMILYLRENKTVVRGSPDRRINVTIYPESVEEKAEQQGSDAAPAQDVTPAEGPAEGPADQVKVE